MILKKERKIDNMNELKLIMVYSDLNEDQKDSFNNGMKQLAEGDLAGACMEYQPDADVNNLSGIIFAEPYMLDDLEDLITLIKQYDVKVGYVIYPQLPNRNSDCYKYDPHDLMDDMWSFTDYDIYEIKEKSKLWKVAEAEDLDLEDLFYGIQPYKTEEEFAKVFKMTVKQFNKATGNDGIFIPLCIDDILYLDE